MHYLITGATGLIGTTICQYLYARQHKVTVWSRNQRKAYHRCGQATRVVENLNEISTDTNIDAVINLAGAPIADTRWTNKRKQVLEQSRISLTQHLIDWLAARSQRPECLISGSAVGWYGDGKAPLLTENSLAKPGYAHQLCAHWEQTALLAETLGMRVCLVRTGLVVAATGGFLQKMLPLYRLGLGGKIGSGQQYMPWIHIHDIANLFIFLSQHKELSGIFNGTAPKPVTNSTFNATLADELHRPALFTVPSGLLKLLLGEMAELLIGGQNAIPEKAEAAGFQFAYTDLKSALHNVIQQ